MTKQSPVHNLYWKKYLNYGHHSVISDYMDTNGMGIYTEVVKIIEQCMKEHRVGIGELQD